MLRKLAAAIMSVSALVPMTVFGLGMGEVDLKSYLNQPLEATIELHQTSGLSPEEIVANLANAREFNQAGVDRTFFLSQLKFSVAENSAGKKVLKVSSKRPVTEPYLNFLVEVQWPAGRLLREYTLLLDPPEFKNELPLAVKAPQRSATDTTGVELSEAAAKPAKQKPGDAKSLAQAMSNGKEKASAKTKAEKAEQTAKANAAAAKLEAEAAASLEKILSSDNQEQAIASEPKASKQAARPQSYVVQRGDTLNSVIDAMPKVEGVSKAQVMVAYQFLNPEAFINENVNLIKRGATLKVPVEDDIRNVSRTSAQEQIAQQNRAWRARVKARQLADTQQLEGRQLDGTGRELTPEAKPDKSDEGRLSLVTPGASESGDKGSGKGDGKSDNPESNRQLADKLALQSDEAEKYGVANEQLQDELKDVERLVEKTERVLALKSDQIANLESQLEAARAGKEAPVDAQQAGRADNAMDEQEQAEQEQAEQEQAEQEQAEQEQAEQAAAELKAAEQAAAEQEAEQAAEQAQIAEQAPPIWKNPIYLAGGGALLAGLLLWLWLRSRQDDDEDDDEDDYEDANFAAELERENGQDDNGLVPLGAMDADEQAVPESFSTEELDRQLLEAEDDFDLDTLLSEADIYVAYGHFPKATELLEGGIKQSPKSTAIHLKLLEVYAESKDAESFEATEAQLRAFDSTPETANRINGLRQEVGLETVGAPAAASAGIASSADEDFDEEETQFITEDEDRVLKESEDFLSLADIEAELDVGNLGFKGDDDAQDLNEFASEETAVKPNDHELDFTFDEEETGVAGNDLRLRNDQFTALDSELDADEDDGLDRDSSANLGSDLDDDLGDDDLGDFSPDDALASIDQEIDELSNDLGLDVNDLELDGDLALPQAGVASLDEDEDTSFSLDDDILPGPVASQDDDLSVDTSFIQEDTAIPAGKQNPDGLTAMPTIDLGEEDLSLLDGVDEVGTKLDLAKAYVDMGDREGAKDVLDEVVIEGNDDQQQEAQEMLAKIRLG